MPIKRRPHKKLSYGTCALCGLSGIPKRAMIKHFAQCEKRVSDASGREKMFHLMAWFLYDPRYWIHFEVPEGAGLRAVDAFLRDTWLECCGHMSAFTIAEERYVAPTAGVTQEFGDRPMNARLKGILLPGMRFFHEYDFGSTTELILDVIAYGAPKAKRGSIRLLARNDPLDIRCRVCKKSATTICLECQEEVTSPKDEAIIYYCEQCVDNRSRHKHDDEEMRLPVVNSPRMGVCGYTG